MRDILKTDTSRFQHLITALSQGAPPHAGLAIGLDRLVQLLCMDRAQSLRDVIAFPKTSAGTELMTGSPSTVDPQALKDLGLKVLLENE